MVLLMMVVMRGEGHWWENVLFELPLKPQQFSGKQSNALLIQQHFLDTWLCVIS